MDAAAADTFGWDKAARLRAERQRRQREREPAALEPPFPWRAIPFPPEVFGIPAGPSPAIDTVAE